MVRRSMVGCPSFGATGRHANSRVSYPSRPALMAKTAVRAMSEQMISSPRPMFLLWALRSLSAPAVFLGEDEVSLVRDLPGASTNFSPNTRAKLDIEAMRLSTSRNLEVEPLGGSGR